MKDRELFDRIAQKCILGILTTPPQRVTGGYMHKMYQLQTTTGKYAVKLLNPAIMKRPDALQNYARAERLERVLQEAGIPIAPALEINGRKMHCVNGQYLYVFQWIEGKALPWDGIRREHCAIAGELLAKIHKIEQAEQSFAGDALSIDWDKYITLADAKCPEIAQELRVHRELLYSAQDQYNAALNSVPPITCICDGDMDSKNVLWVDGNPVIIDLECLDYGNLFLEMFQLALGWSGGVLCNIDYECLNAFLTAYSREYGELSVNWDGLYGVGFGWLDWLEYNVKRALGIECEHEEERQLGIGQVRETMGRIVYYDSVRDELLRHLSVVHG